jgi:hypothetical protein
LRRSRNDHCLPVTCHKIIFMTAFFVEMKEARP